MIANWTRITPFPGSAARYPADRARMALRYVNKDNVDWKKYSKIQLEPVSCR